MLLFSQQKPNVGEDKALTHGPHRVRKFDRGAGAGADISKGKFRNFAHCMFLNFSDVWIVSVSGHS